MTREEAIKWLKDMLQNYDLPMEQYQIALEMAIKALEREQKSPCDLCRYNPPSSADGKPCTMCPATGKE